MGTFIIVFIVGNIALICSNAENDSFEAFNVLMAVFLIMYLIASFFNWITADKEETKDEQEKGLMLCLVDYYIYIRSRNFTHQCGSIYSIYCNNVFMAYCSYFFTYK